MKVFLLLVLFTVIASADHHEHHDHHHEIKTVEQIKQARKDCMDELKLSDEDRGFLNKYEYPDKESIHKYVYCTNLKLDFFDDAHGFHLDHLVEQLGQNKDKTELREKISKCLDKNEQNSSKDLWAYRNYKCMLDSHLFDDLKHAVVAQH